MRFIDRISEVDFDFIYSQSIDLETKFEMFIAKFWSCFEECFPLKTKNISTKKFNNPWITREIRQEISRRHDMYKLKLEGKIPKELYSNFNTHVNKIIFNAKKDYYSKKLDNVNGDMRKHWSFLNDMLNRKSKIPVLQASK